MSATHTATKTTTDTRTTKHTKYTQPSSNHHTDSPTELLHAMATLPTNHPERPTLRDKTIQAWLPLANHLAHRYTGRGEPTDDLTQTATIGLIKAIDKYDPTRGINFTAYAIPTIIGELKRHFRDHTWDIRVPRRLQELRLAISEANNTLHQTLHRSPTITDIATHLHLTEEDILEGLEGARAYNTISLTTPTGNTDHPTPLADQLGTPDPQYELAELRATLTPALATLTPREQKILTLRFYGNQTQTQIAQHIGVSQMHISRLLTRALTKLRNQLANTY